MPRAAKTVGQLRRQEQPRKSASERGYDWRWQKASKAYRTANPWCVKCLATGRYVLAQCVDHVIPHKGDERLFWDEANWQSLCVHHHAVKTATEDGGFGR